MGYETEIAIVLDGPYPMHTEDAYAIGLQTSAAPTLVRADKLEDGAVPERSKAITLHNYGVAVLVFDLCKVGTAKDHELGELFQHGRDKSQAQNTWPLLFGCGRGEIWHDLYNEPLGAHDARLVLQAVTKTVERPSRKAPYRRFLTLQAILRSFVDGDRYQGATVLTRGT